MGREIEALEYAERSKARNLLEALHQRDNSKSVPDESLKVEPMPYSQIRHLVDNRTALVEWFITEAHLLTFIIAPSGQLSVLSSSRENISLVVDNYLQNYPETHKKKMQWSAVLPSLLPRFAEILKIEEIVTSLPPDCDRLILIPHLFLHDLPLHALPLANGDFLTDRFTVGYAPSCQLLKKIRERPRLDLHRLFAVQDPSEDLPASAIEIAALNAYFSHRDIFAREGAKKAIFDSEALQKANCIHLACHGFYNVGSPLQSAIVLADGVIPTPENTDTRDDPLVSVEAKREGFCRIFWLKLAKHNVLVALMYLAGFLVSRSLDLSKCLTLEAIFSLELSECALVTLSACETGLTDVTSTSDEYIGLPNGFILAGSPNVVSSLWPVADFSSALLMAKFYENLFAVSESSHLHVAAALNKAQIWLRDISKRELLEWCETARLSQEIQSSIIEHPRIKYAKPDKKPFASPYFWAAFQAIGR
jgi:CHAT domain-containing protein